jgi:hypothetical protein
MTLGSNDGSKNAIDVGAGSNAMDLRDETMTAAIEWLSKIWLGGGRDKPDLSTYVNVESLDVVVHPGAFVQRKRLDNPQLTLEVAAGSLTLEFSNSLSDLDIGAIYRREREIQEKVYAFGGECRVGETIAILKWIEGGVIQQYRKLLKGPKYYLGAQLASAVHNNQAAVAVFLLELARRTSQGRSPESPLTVRRLGEAVGERGRNLRLLAQPTSVRTFADLRFVEEVVALPEGWHGTTMLMSLAGGPSVRRLIKEPPLTWTRADNVITLTWTDRFTIDNAADAQLFSPN